MGAVVSQAAGWQPCVAVPAKGMEMERERSTPSDTNRGRGDEREHELELSRAKAQSDAETASRTGKVNARRMASHHQKSE